MSADPKRSPKPGPRTSFHCPLPEAEAEAVYRYLKREKALPEVRQRIGRWLGVEAYD